MTRAILALALAACASHAAAAPPKTFGGTREVSLQIPASFDPAKSYPLIVVLHGYGASGFVQQAYFGMPALVSAGDAFVLAPDGLTDSLGHQFWNADPACCDFDGTNPDDVAYIGGLIDAVSAAWPIDPGAVLVIGHSNGGYMAYRMACERADVVTNIVVLAGAAASNPAGCAPRRSVEVLHLHGSLDTVVPYSPNADASVTQWAQHDGCAATRTAGVDQDLDVTILGTETHTETTGGCPPRIAVDLWTIEGAGHVPSFGASFASTIFQYFVAHRR